MSGMTEGIKQNLNKLLPQKLFILFYLLAFAPVDTFSCEF